MYLSANQSVTIWCFIFICSLFSEHDVTSDFIFMVKSMSIFQILYLLICLWFYWCINSQSNVGSKVKSNQCGHQANFQLVWLPWKIKQCRKLVKYILCCYLVKMNYLGCQLKHINCGHQVKFNWCGYPKKLHSVVN